MKQPGRKSLASLSVLPAMATKPPPPPEKLSEPEKALWRETTAALRPNWFQGCEPVLEAYVGSVMMGREISDTLATCSPSSDKFADLVRLRCNVSATIASLATKLRLTPQSSRDSRNVKHVSTRPKPWQIRASGPPDSPSRPFEGEDPLPDPEPLG
jgi:hypothetical protein